MTLLSVAGPCVGLYDHMGWPNAVALVALFALFAWIAWLAIPRLLK